MRLKLVLFFGYCLKPQNVKLTVLLHLLISEYYQERVINSPFKWNNKSQAWRFIILMRLACPGKANHFAINSTKQQNATAGVVCMLWILINWLIVLYLANAVWNKTEIFLVKEMSRGILLRNDDDSWFRCGKLKHSGQDEKSTIRGLHGVLGSFRPPRFLQLILSHSWHFLFHLNFSLLFWKKNSL